MTLCLDIHTHHPAPRPQAVVSVGIHDFNPIDGQFYSVGIHPWETKKNPTADELAELERIAALPCVVAIGETGIDKLNGGPLFRQMNVLNRHIELSEKLKKPLILHDVKAHDIITGLKREMEITQKWLVHGFRAKSTVAKMLTDIGIYLSFGEKYNSESLLSTPQSMILAETDESELTIEEIIARLSQTIGKEMKSVIAENTANFLFNIPQIEILDEDI